ncbi:MAG: hypothetical protein QM572_07090 [Nocardioides sp.]|uniref:hypothetical protein n=1 Tax=Nocardioides sp. TaxID=35761 RepID=UPI0039E54741
MIRKLVAASAASAVLATGAVALGAGEADAAYGPPAPIPASQKKPTILHIKRVANKPGHLTVRQTKILLDKIDALYSSGLITSTRRLKLRIYVLLR